MKTLVLANQKGGVGKSAIACQLAYFGVQSGLRVLVLDLDHQRNCSQPIIRSGRAALARFSVSAIMTGQEVDLPQGPFVVVQGDDTLMSLERQPERHNAFVNAFSDFLTSVDDRFDLCIIDTNPNPDIRYVAALVTANYLLSPVELNQEAIDGIGALLNHPRFGYHKIKAVMNQGLDLIGILPNLVESTPFQRSNLTQLVTQYASLLIPLDDGGLHFASIPARTAVAESQAAGVPIWLLRQAVPPDQVGRADPASMPVRTAARDAWRDIKPSFVAITNRMGLGGRHGP